MYTARYSSSIHIRFFSFRIDIKFLFQRIENMHMPVQCTSTFTLIKEKNAIWIRISKIILLDLFFYVVKWIISKFSYLNEEFVIMLNKK